MTQRVRSVTLAVPSVGCSNSACLALHRARPEVVPLVHQHGCSQLGDDVGLTRTILARLMANPNVSRALVIGLGCESNQADSLASAARDNGAAVAEIGIQEAGGVAAAVSGGLDALDRLPARDPLPHRLTIGLLVDEAAGEGADAYLREIGELLVRQGFAVLVSPLPRVVEVRPTPVGAGVPAVWRGRGTTSRRDRRDVRAGLTDVERLTALVAAGAEVTVVLTADASPIGSPIAPTVKVSCEAAIDQLDDVVDVPYRTGRRLAERTAEAVASVIAGRLSAAERGGARDIALWRLAPTF